MTKNVSDFLEEHRDEIIQMRLKRISCNDIAEKFGLNRSTVNGWLNRNGIKIRSEMNSDNIEKIINMYVSDKTSIETIAKQLHFSACTVSRILKENGVEIRPYTEANKKYSINEYYFDNIDTQNKAYILGLLYADGCRAKNSNSIKINLQEKDKHILEHINIEIGSTRPLRFLDYSHDPTRQNQYLLSIDNKHIAESLYKYGIVPNKEFELVFPDWLRHDLIRHFIRGYLDGDGYISKNCKEKRMGFTGTENMMIGIKKYLKKELNVHSFIFSSHHKNTVTRSLGIAGGIQVEKTLNHLYEDAEMFLFRKYKIYYDLYVKKYLNNSQIA